MSTTIKMSLHFHSPAYAIIQTEYDRDCLIDNVITHLVPGTQTLFVSKSIGFFGLHFTFIANDKYVASNHNTFIRIVANNISVLQRPIDGVVYKKVFALTTEKLVAEAIARMYIPDTGTVIDMGNGTFRCDRALVLDIIGVDSLSSKWNGCSLPEKTFNVAHSHNCPSFMYNTNSWICNDLDNGGGIYFFRSLTRAINYVF